MSRTRTAVLTLVTLGALAAPASVIAANLPGNRSAQRVLRGCRSGRAGRLLVRRLRECGEPLRRQRIRLRPREQHARRLPVRRRLLPAEHAQVARRYAARAAASPASAPAAASGTATGPK